jgi:nucleotide-binding universal stress UspA family protein
VPIQKILVAYDETESSKRALERAVELARAFDAKVTITSVAPLVHTTVRGAGPVDPADTPQMHRDELERAHAHLEEQGLDAELIPASGDPAGAIVHIADDVGADLVVVGTREPGLTDRILHHSVSQQVARNVHRDLLIVHPDHTPPS